MTCGNPADSIILHRSHLRAGRSPRRLQKRQLPCNSHWNGPPPTTPSNHSICTGSKLLLKATHDLAGQLSCVYQGTSGSLATGSQTPPPKQPLQPTATLLGLFSYASAKFLIHRTLVGPPPANSQTAEVYGGVSWSKDCKAISNRADAVLPVRLQAGHTTLLQAYAKLLYPYADAQCPFCKEELQTIERWLRRCPRLDAPSGRPLALKPQQQQ